MRHFLKEDYQGLIRLIITCRWLIPVQENKEKVKHIVKMTKHKLFRAKKIELRSLLIILMKRLKKFMKKIKKNNI